MNKQKMLEEFSNAFGPSGFEDPVLEVARRHALPQLDIREDSLRNLYLRRPRQSDKPLVMLDAHTDEVGFMVQSIRPNGLLQIVPLGGWVNYTIPAHTVLVQSRDGQLHTGVVATRPPHYMSEEMRKAPLDIAMMSVDVGATSAEEVRESFGIGVGAPVAPDTQFRFHPENGVMMGKAFDCRAGCACVVEAMNTLCDEELAVEPVGALAAQEEVGTRGAAITARTVKPAVAIAFEGCPADDSFAEEWASQTCLKKGPMLRHIDQGMITNPRFQRFALDTAADLGIPVQEAVRAGGRTNGAPIHLSGQGVPTIVIGIPVRYIHTHYGYASLRDYEASVALGLAILRRLTPAVIAGF